MLALKLGSIAVFALTGVLVGTYKLTNQENLDILTNEFSNPNAALSLATSIQTVSVENSDQQPRDSQLEVTFLSQSSLPQEELNEISFSEIKRAVEKEQEIIPAEEEIKPEAQLTEAPFELDKSKEELDIKPSSEVTQNLVTSPEIKEPEDNKDSSKTENSILEDFQKTGSQTYISLPEASTKPLESQNYVERQKPEVALTTPLVNSQSQESTPEHLSSTVDLDSSIQLISPPRRNN